MDIDNLPNPTKRRNMVIVNDREIPRRYLLLAGAGASILFGGAFSSIVWSNWSSAQESSRSDEEVSDLIALARRQGWTYKVQNAGGADRYQGCAPFPDASSGLSAWDDIEGRLRGRTIRCFEYRDAKYTQLSGSNHSRAQTTYYSIFSATTPAVIPRTVIRGPGDLEGEFANDKLEKFLRNDPRAADTPLRFDKGELITWYKGRLRANKVLPKLNYLCDVLEHTPALAWS
ncbi:hypothetical protein [Streptomyces spiralis]|uniref:hypothetical protein n=1 Tax=Streptomyces spiralis TaxID=66376 RepID=UPI0036A0B2EB